MCLLCYPLFLISGLGDNTRYSYEMAGRGDQNIIRPVLVVEVSSHDDNFLHTAIFHFVICVRLGGIINTPITGAGTGTEIKLSHG